MAKKLNTSTRSYTLGLLAPSDVSNRLPLWKRLFRTHYAICMGAREFGELYLNLRGGLSASLADCADEQDSERRRLLQRGARRILALGWLSIESVRGSGNHPHRVRERVCEQCNCLAKPNCESKHPSKVCELQSGQSLPKDLAEKLLREILSDYKGVIQETELVEWVSDCNLALAANIRPDAVIVNRAAAFEKWQNSVGDASAEMPEQARRILFTMCGEGFASLTLPDEEAVQQDDTQADVDASGVDISDDVDSVKSKETDEAAEPSNASRGVFGDLFGGDPAEKLSRATGKEEFATKIREMLATMDGAPPTREAIIGFRQQQDLPELDTSHPDLYPQEVTSSGAPTAVAKRYRKLLVCLDMWPKSNKEDGTPRKQAVSKFEKHVTAQDEQSRRAHINALDLIDACPRPMGSDDKSNQRAVLQRVFTPPWASAIAYQVAAMTGMPADVKAFNEFKRLMFALAARRISQTQTWTKRNETERHKAAVKEDAARKKLEELDGNGYARTWLKSYEQRRGEKSGSLSEFRITRRMIGECEAVFKAWQGIETTNDRAEQMAAIQAKAEKFGDPMFYADLSDDAGAGVIWKGAHGAELLKQWVKLRQAQHDQQRLKIPRFCHPDPFHHPTWCEFGGSSKPGVWYALKPDSKPRNPEPGGNADASRRLWMLLPNLDEKQARAVPIRWRSKRLSNDLGGMHNAEKVPIPRADRLSRAAANLPLKDKNQQPIDYRPAHPFTKDAKGWNARLQLDRDTLERLEQYWDAEHHEWRDEGKALGNARWFITFAPTLSVSDGPGRGIHPKLGWRSNPHTELNKKQKRDGYAKLILSRLPGLRVLSVDLGHRFAASCAVWEAISSEDMAGVCRQYGHREPQESDLFIHLTRTVQKECKKGRNKGKILPVTETIIYRRIGEDFLRDPKTGQETRTPHPAPWARLDRQFFIKLQGEDYAAREASNEEIWNVHQLEVELGRSVPLIDRLVRAGWGESKKEQKARLEALRALGWKPIADAEAIDEMGAKEGKIRKPPLAVDELMFSAVRTMQHALRRHGDRARIAFAMTADYKPMPGDRKYYFSEAKDASANDDQATRANKHIEYIQDTLALWHELAFSRGWQDTEAQKLWKEHVAKLPGYVALDEISGEVERRARQKTNKEKLHGIAKALLENKSLRLELHEIWAKRWKGDDGEKAETEHETDNAGQRTGKTRVTIKATGWHARLRWFEDWILPHGKKAANDPAIRHVGGLSLKRLATLTEFRRKVQIGFFTRLHPDGEKCEIKEKFAQRTLDTIERMREQRVKQIASRIVEAALGVGKEEKRQWDPLKKKWRYLERPRELLYSVDENGEEHGKRRFQACHAVAIENLRNYRPDELQTRRENRSLMNWSAGKVRKYLEEACQLHGLHLREVMPNYTSRQCSRTGLPGMRCVDVPVDQNSGEPEVFWWEKVLASATKKTGNGDHEKKEDAESRFIVDLAKRLNELKANGGLPKTVLIPRKGGDLFVTAPPWSCCADGHSSCSMCKDSHAIQADLNAAANIGLRALLDPDFMGKWWYVPCDASTGRPVKEKCAGALCLDLDGVLLPSKEAAEKEGKKGNSKGGEIVNAWRDVGNFDESRRWAWAVHSKYWNGVSKRVVSRLRMAHGLDPTD